MIKQSVDLAEVAYVTYHNTMGWRDERGNPTCHFDDLSDKEIECWDAVVTRVLEENLKNVERDSPVNLVSSGPVPKKSSKLVTPDSEGYTYVPNR